MMEIILNAALLGLVLVGVVSIMHTIALKMVMPSHPQSLMLLMPVSQKNEELELALRDADLRARIFGGGLCQKVIILDCGMDEESRRICEATCKSSSAMTVCGCDELPELLRKCDLQN